MDQDDRQDNTDGPGGYWAARRHYRYYAAATALARRHAPSARTALDVGPRDTRLLEAVDWVESRVAIDEEVVPVVRGATNLRGDFLRFQPARRFDLVFCLQVIEHVDRPDAFLRKLLATGDAVIVSVPYRWGSHPGAGHRHDAIDGARLARWAGRPWVEAELVEDEGRERLIAVFRGGDRPPGPVEVDFGASEETRAWLGRLASEIEAVRLPRRRPAPSQAATARLRDDDPLREQVAGSFGAYAVRALWNALGFDEHRKHRWRLEHKLVQALVFNHYTGGAFPRSWGLDDLVRRELRGPLVDALLAGRLFAKRTLGHLSGDFGVAESTHQVLGMLLDPRGEGLGTPGTPVDEGWIVQERIPIAREYRVHSLEDRVLPGMTFDRYGSGAVPEGRDEVDAYVAGLLRRLPDALVGESLYAWDIARLPCGGFRAIEVNLVGFHPVYERGFQASGFFQYHPVGPPLLAALGRHVATHYNVHFALADGWRSEPNRHGLYLRIFRHYLGRRPPATGDEAAGDEGPPDRIDGVANLRASELGRFALLRETLARTGSAIGTLWAAVPDRDLAAVSASAAAKGPGCVVVAESELVPELGEFRDVPAGVRRQVARLALVERTAGRFCLDLGADVVCVRRFGVDDLIRGGKAACFRHINEVHSDRYEAAEAVLRVRRSGWVHGSATYLYSRRGVAALIEHLGRLAADEAGAGAGRSWRRYLLGRRGWTLGPVYFTCLEASGLDERDYFPNDACPYHNCAWSAEDWDDWDPAPSFKTNGEHFFTVLQLGDEVPADAVRRRLAPFWDATAGAGGARRGGE